MNCDYQEIINLPFCTDFYTKSNDNRIRYSNIEIRGGFESFLPKQEIEHIELPEWYMKAVGVSKCDHCIFNSRIIGNFHFLNFKTKKINILYDLPIMYFVDAIFI